MMTFLWWLLIIIGAVALFEIVTVAIILFTSSPVDDVLDIFDEEGRENP